MGGIHSFTLIHSYLRARRDGVVRSASERARFALGHAAVGARIPRLTSQNRDIAPVSALKPCLFDPDGSAAVVLVLLEYRTHCFYSFFFVRQQNSESRHHQTTYEYSYLWLTFILGCCTSTRTYSTHINLFFNAFWCPHCE